MKNSNPIAIKLELTAEKLWTDCISCHVHLVPRYKGDVENPRGGIRGGIPDKRITNLDE